MESHPHMRRHSTGYKLANDGQDTRTHPVKAAETVIGSAASIVIERRYAAAFCWRLRCQFQGRRSAIRLAG
jgi:hypothetical protein